MRDDMVEPGGIVSDPEGGLWRVLRVDDRGIAIVPLRGGERKEIGWEEYCKEWELRFP